MSYAPRGLPRPPRSSRAPRIENCPAWKTSANIAIAWQKVRSAVFVPKDPAILELDPRMLKHSPLIPAQAGIQGQRTGSPLSRGRAGLSADSTASDLLALGTAHQRDEAHLLLRIVAEQAGELGGDGERARLLDAAHRHAGVLGLEHDGDA